MCLLWLEQDDLAVARAAEEFQAQIQLGVAVNDAFVERRAAVCLYSAIFIRIILFTSFVMTVRSLVIVVVFIIISAERPRKVHDHKDEPHAEKVVLLEQEGGGF